MEQSRGALQAAQVMQMILFWKLGESPGPFTRPSTDTTLCRRRNPKAWEECAADAWAKEARLLELLAIQL